MLHDSLVVTGSVPPLTPPPRPAALNFEMKRRGSCSTMAPVARNMSQQTLDNCFVFFSVFNVSVSALLSIPFEPPHTLHHLLIVDTGLAQVTKSSACHFSG